jgi:hypothetical protein
MIDKSNSASPKPVLSDPCQIPIVDPVTKRKRICGQAFEALASHLRSHNTPGMTKKTKWTRERYEREFPGFSLGKAAYSPPPEAIEKLQRGAQRNAEGFADTSDDMEGSGVDLKDGEVKLEDYKTYVPRRKVEIWDQVNRDVAAEVFCEEAARAEYRIREINRRYDAAFARGDIDKMKKLRPELVEQQEILKAQMNFLDMNVKSRRAQGGLGNDTVAQIISNFGATVRKWSEERMQTFKSRIAEVRRVQGERARTKTLADILDASIDEIIEQEVNEADYDARLAVFVERAKL